MTSANGHATKNGHANGKPANGHVGKPDDLAAQLERLPPQDLECEQCVLGSILIWPDCLDEIVLILRAEDFYAPAHRILFETMVDMHKNGKRIDSRLVINALKRANKLEEIGGLIYLAEIADSVPTAANAVYYAKEVRDCAILRSMLHAGMEMITAAHDGSGTPRERLNHAEAMVMRLLERGTSNNLQTITDVLHAALASIDERTARGQLNGLRTGFVELDHLLGGMRPGELLILAGRPGHGKSALASNIVENVTIEQRKMTLLVSLEMSAPELGNRLFSSLSRIDMHKLNTNNLKAEERKQLCEVQNAVHMAPMRIDDQAPRNMLEIASTARYLKRTGDLALLVIDYLQLIEPEKSNDRREQQVALICRRLKYLARELQIPVLCLAQLNREVEKEKDYRPRLSHLRESGSIEQDADIVLFVHREDEYRQPNQWDGKALVTVAKHRNGPRGHVELTWLRQCTRFENAPAADGWDKAQNTLDF